MSFTQDWPSESSRVRYATVVTAGYMRTNCMILARSDGASILICSGVIERTFISIAYEAHITFLSRNAIKIVVPFDLQASSGDVGVVPWQPGPELVVLQEVADDAEGIPGPGDLDARVERDVEEGILGIVAAAV